MKLDVELVRAIVMAIEGLDDGSPAWIDLTISDYSPRAIAGHVKLLRQHGLIEAIDLTDKDDFDWRPVSLTMQGHEFLSVVRNDTRWRGIREKAAKLTSEVTMEGLKGLVAESAAKLFGS